MYKSILRTPVPIYWARTPNLTLTLVYVAGAFAHNAQALGDEFV